MVQGAPALVFIAVAIIGSVSPLRQCTTVCPAGCHNLLCHPSDSPELPGGAGGASGVGSSSGGIPAWKRRERNKRSLGRQAEKTLEMVYSRTQWPSEAVVASMW